MIKKKISEFLNENEWWIIGVSAFVTAIFGFFGFYQYSVSNKLEQTFLDLLYLTWQLFPLQSGAVTGKVPCLLELARWLAPAILIFAAIKAIWALTREHINMWLMKRWNNHVVVCGLGQKGFCLVKDFIAEGNQVVIIESNGNNDELAALREHKGVAVLIGEATDVVLLHKARIEYANYLIAVTGDDQANIEIAIKASQLLKKSPNGNKLKCYVHVFNMRLRQLFYNHDIFKEDSNNFSAQLFNLYEKSARLLFEEFSPDKYIPVPQSSSKPAHILVIGFGWTGESLVTQAIRTGQYANEKELRITIIDKEAINKELKFYNDYPNDNNPSINDFALLDFRDVNVELLTHNNFKELKNDKPAVCFICLGNDEVWNLSTASRVRKLFGQNSPPIVVSMSQKTGISTLIDAEKLLENENIHLFNIIDKACSKEQVINEMLDTKAKAIHECYVAHRKLGTQKTWDELTEPDKDTNRCPADHISIKLRAIGCDQKKMESGDKKFEFTPEEISLLERIEHRRWMAERTVAGWIYAPGDKDKEKKTHKDLVPYDELPEDEQCKDKESIEDIPKVLEKVGQCIVRNIFKN